jgi:hypothetical protein
MMREFEAMEYAFEAANDVHRNAQRAAADAKRERHDKVSAKRSKSNAQLAEALGEEADNRARGWRAFKGGTSKRLADTSDAAPLAAHESKSHEIGKADQISHNATEPICCWVCRRKFPNALALERHERISELHKENLKKR